MVNVAIQVAKLLEESERLTTGQAKQAVVLVSDVRQATATNYKAKQDLLQARLGYFIGARRANGPLAGHRDWEYHENSSANQNGIQNSECCQVCCHGSRC